MLLRTLLTCFVAVFSLAVSGFTTPTYQPEFLEFDLPQGDAVSEVYQEETRITKDIMDRSKDWLVAYLDGISGNIDAFFVDTFFSEEIVSDDVAGSRAKFSFYTRRELGEPVDYKFGVSVKMALPNSNERLKLLVESEDEDALREADPIESVENVEYTAALRFIINETDQWKTNIDGGVRWGLPPDPFVRLRARRYAYFSEWELKATQRFSYFTTDGWESESDVQLNYPININKQFRFSTRADYLLNDGFFELGYGAGLYHRFSKKAALGFVASANGDTQFGATFDSYAAGIRYRQQIWKQYVFAELSPEFIWTRETQYESTPVIMFRLETVFSQ